MPKAKALSRYMLIWVSLLLSGCPATFGGVSDYFVSKDQTQKNAVEHDGAQDEVIMASVKAALKRDSRLSPYYLYADSVKGRVSIYGTVPTMELSKHAIHLAERISGVKSVNSKIKVKP